MLKKLLVRIRNKMHADILRESKKTNESMQKQAQRLKEQMEKMGLQVQQTQKQLSHQLNHIEMLVHQHKQKEEIELEALEYISVQMNCDEKEMELGRYCPICKERTPVFLPYLPYGSKGITPRKEVKCPNCSSFERHRFLFQYLEKAGVIERLLSTTNGDQLKLLHFAPEQCFHAVFSKDTRIDYFPVDIRACF